MEVQSCRFLLLIVMLWGIVAELPLPLCLFFFFLLLPLFFYFVDGWFGGLSFFFFLGLDFGVGFSDLGFLD